MDQDLTGRDGPSDFERSWRERFSRFGNRYDDDAHIAGWTITGLRSRYSQFKRIWRAAPAGSLWLDVGCGAGTYTRFLADEGLTVLGVDYSAPSLAKARARCPENILWCVADASRLPLQSSLVHGVVCLGVLQAVSDTRPFAIEFARCLQPDGLLLVDGLNLWCLPNLAGEILRRLRGKQPYLRYENPLTLPRRLRSAGFTVSGFHWIPLLPGRWHHFQTWLEKPGIRWMIARLPLIGLLCSHSFLIEAVNSPRLETKSLEEC